MKKEKKKNKKLPMLFRIFDPKEILYDFIKWTGGWPFLFFYRVKRLYYKTEKKGLFKGSYIISANHISLTDIFRIGTIFWFRRVGYVAMEELFNTKLRNWFFRAGGCIPVNRENVSLKTFKDVEKKLNRGHLVTVFPEGRVSLDGVGKDYKAGVVMMALFADCPILPIYYQKSKKWYHRQKVVIGPKFYVKDHFTSKYPSVEEINQVVAKLKALEQELADHYENN